VFLVPCRHKYRNERSLPRKILCGWKIPEIEKIPQDNTCENQKKRDDDELIDDHMSQEKKPPVKSGS